MTSEDEAVERRDAEDRRLGDDLVRGDRVANVAGAAPVDERRMHPAWVLVRSISLARNLVPAFLAIAVSAQRFAVPGVLALLVVLLVTVVLEWRATSYAVVDGALRLRKGVLNRSERVIPASRISALDTTRGVVQRAFGLVSLEVQTAGGGKHAELRLQALTAEEAERLRGVLGHAAADREPEVDASRQAEQGAGGGAGGAPGDVGAAAGRATAGSTSTGPATDHANSWPTGTGPADGRADTTPARPLLPGFALSPGAAAEARGERVYAISGRDLLVAALTGPQIGVVALLVGSALSQFQDLLPDSLAHRIGDEVQSADVATIVTFVVLGLLLAAAVSVVGTVLAFAEFTVVRDDRRLRIRRGLLTERTGTVPLDRIHGVRIVEGLVRRPLGYVTVQVEVAGYGADSELLRTLVPLVHRRELPALLERMLPELRWPSEPLEGPPARARRRYWTVPVLLSVVPAIVALAVLPGAWKVVTVLPLVLAAALGDARWRGAGWRLDTDTLAVRWQLVARTTLLALPRRAQHLAVRTQPFQRRAGLARFDIVLATKRRGSVRHLDAAVAGGLLRAVAARTAVRPSPAILAELPLNSAAPPE